MRMLRKVFRSRAFKLFMIPLVMVSAVALGAGTGYLTTKQAAPVTVEAAPTIVPDKSAYSYLDKNKSSDTSNDPSVAPTAANTPSNNPPAVTNNQTSQPTVKTQTVPSCDQTKKADFTSQYNQAIANETTQHNNWTNPYDQTTDPTNYQSALDQENSRHSDALLQINQTYSNQLSSINCI